MNVYVFAAIISAVLTLAYLLGEEISNQFKQYDEDEY